VFEVAYFWRLSPDTVLDMSLTKIAQHNAQAERIVQMMDRAGDGG
jgi:hypothetical protein